MAALELRGGLERRSDDRDRLGRGRILPVGCGDAAARQNRGEEKSEGSPHPI
jgi:hypothetical protein